MSKLLVTVLTVSFIMSQNMAQADYGSPTDQPSGYMQDQNQSDQTAPNANQGQTSTNARNPAYFRQNQSNPNSPGYNQSPNYNQTPSNPSNPNSMTAPEANNSSDDQNNQIAADYSNTPSNPQDSASSEADRQINAKIRDRITGWFKDRAKNVSLRTSNGVVTLVGLVKNNEDVDAIIVEVRKVPGVRNVNNNLQIANASADSNRANSNPGEAYNSKFPQDRAATESDRQLNDKIRNKITGWFSDNFKHIALNTNNGVVTINGYVDSNNDIEKLQKELRKVEGVRSINAHIQVRQPQP